MFKHSPALRRIILVLGEFQRNNFSPKEAEKKGRPRTYIKEENAYRIQASDLGKLRFKESFEDQKTRHEK